MGLRITCSFSKQKNWISQIYDHFRARNLLCLDKAVLHTWKKIRSSINSWKSGLCSTLLPYFWNLGRPGMLTQWMSEKIKTLIHLKVRNILGKVREKEIGWFLALISVCSQTDEIKHFRDIKFGSKFPWGLSKTLPHTNTESLTLCYSEFLNRQKGNLCDFYNGCSHKKKTH